MPLIINTNVTYLNAQRHLGNNTNMLAKSMEKLASGYRINRAGDDAAGLQLSENLRAQIRGSKKAYDNVQDGLNVLNIADGSLQTITDNLQRVRELSVQAANDTYATAQRTAIAQEIVQLLHDIDRIASATQFNGVYLLDGNVTNFTLQVGANASTALDTINIASALGTATASVLGISVWSGTTTSITTVFDSGGAAIRGFLSDVGAALSRVNVLRGNLGAFTNRLEGTANNLSIAIENFSSSESRIRNVDVAAESAMLVRNQILQQAASSILGQANQSPSLALQLLQG